MTLKSDLEDKVREIFRSRWTERDGYKVPEESSIALGNDAVKIDATVLYADMSGSTALVDGYKNWFAAEIYKSYLYCAAKIIRSEGGSITAYDGDRIMAVFIGDMKNTIAVRCALKINYARIYIVNRLKNEKYSANNFELRHVVGIDTSRLYVARTGIRGANDLVWVGRAANYAAKLTGLSADYPTWITKSVYTKIADSAKFSNGMDMWEPRTWTAMSGFGIYRSNYYWPLE